jgi:hypothetical protein
MSTALKRFIEAGELRLEALEEPERTIVAAKLHNEILRRFPGGIDENPELEFDGNYLFEGPISDKDVEDKMIQDHDDRLDNASASDMAKDGCYDESGEEESDRGGFRFRPIPIDQRLKSQASTVLRAEGTTPAEAGPQTFNDAPDVGNMGHIVSDPAIHQAKDAVSAGQIYSEEMDERMGYARTGRKSYHDRTSLLIFRAGQAWKKAALWTKKTCEFCQREFEAATANVRYCDMCRSPQMCAIRKRTKIEDV